jgi:hypothetical protein
MPHLHWLLPGASTSPEQLEQARLASTRLRAAVALSALRSVGWVVSSGELVAEQAEKLVVGKIGGDITPERTTHWLTQIAAAKVRGARIYLDYTDHHLGFESKQSVFYRAAIGLVSDVVCSSAAMADLVGKFWSGTAAVIPDAIEIQCLPPKRLVGSPRTALWFGDASNIGYLKQFLANAFRPDQRVRIIVLTNEAGAAQFTRPALTLPANVRVELGPWSVANMLAAANVSDFCLIPSDPQDPKKAGVSANRLITALALGLPVAADVMQAYAEYANYFVDLKSGKLPGLITDPLKLRESVVQAQQQVIPRFSSQVLGQQWGELFNDR